MDNVSVLSALVGFGIVIAVAAWMWKKQNSDKAARIAREAYEAAQKQAKDAAEKVKAEVKSRAKK